MNKEEIKETIIEELKGGGCCPYIEMQEEELNECDWEEIAEAVGCSVMYDPCGLSYTLERCVEYIKVARYEKN